MNAPYTRYLIETLLTLLAVCAVAWVILYGARRMGIGRPSGPVELCGHLPIEGRRAIYLVKVGPLVFVVGASEAGLSKIGEIPAADLPASLAPAEPFPSVLARIFSRPRRDREGP
jgi:flagellar biogenesis protein FliO